MPMTVNGFGTSVCGGRGDIGWGSFDGMEWFVAAYMPLIPYKAIHTFDWEGEQYRAVPIRWSAELMVRTFLARWMWGLILIGVVLGVIGVVDRKGPNVWLLGAGLFMIPVGILLGVVIRVTDRRNKEIRLVLGPMAPVGNCDPVHMPRQLLEENVKPSQLAYGTRTYAEAVENLLEEGRYAQAMWAARVSTALEDAAEGEALTNMVLKHPDVMDGIERVRKTAQEWANCMLSASERQPAPEEPEEALPVEDDGAGRGRRGVDGRRRSRRDDEDY